MLDQLILDLNISVSDVNGLKKGHLIASLPERSVELFRRLSQTHKEVQKKKLRSATLFTLVHLYFIFKLNIQTQFVMFLWKIQDTLL